MDRLAAVFLTAAVTFLLQDRSAMPTLGQDVAASTDVRQLERLCGDLSFAESEFAARSRRIGSVKGIRSAAYLRLGAIGSGESLAAIARLEKTAFERSVLPGPGISGKATYHPAPHMSDSVLSPAARLRLADGRDAAAYVMDWYGPPLIFLSLRTGDAWSSPSMIPFSMNAFGIPGIAMIELPGGRLRFVLSAPDHRPGLAPRVEPTPDAMEVRIAEVMRDTDGDGWTDIAERSLGLNWNEPDSDHDGMADGRDDVPLVSALNARTGEDEQILQRAIFAIFGLTESAGALYVADNSRRFHPFGLPGPLFYAERQGGVRVTWKITGKTEDTATVEITDYEGPLAASGNNITLKKIAGGWYAVSIRMAWIS